jgi:hypothetical protein
MQTTSAMNPTSLLTSTTTAPTGIADPIKTDEKATMKKTGTKTQPRKRKRKAGGAGPIQLSDLRLLTSDYNDMVKHCLVVEEMGILRLTESESRVVKELRTAPPTSYSLRARTELSSLYARLMLASPAKGVLDCLSVYLSVEGFGQTCPVLCKLYFQYKDGVCLKMEEITELLIGFNACVAPLEMRTRLFARDCVTKGVENPLGGGAAPPEQSRPKKRRAVRRTRLSGFNVYLTHQWRDHRASILSEAKLGSAAMTLLSKRWKELGDAGQKAFKDLATTKNEVAVAASTCM